MGISKSRLTELISFLAVLVMSVRFSCTGEGRGGEGRGGEGRRGEERGGEGRGGEERGGEGRGGEGSIVM